MEFYEKQHEQNKHKPDWKTPTAISSRPELEPWEATYIQDFYTLSSSRQIGMSVGPIPVSEILKYVEHFEIPESDDFIEIIQAMDGAYMVKVAEKQEKESKVSQTGNKTVRGVK